MMDTIRRFAQDDTNRLETIISLLPGHVYWKDRDFKYLGCNLQQALSLGLSSPEEIIGKTDYDISPKSTADLVRISDVQVISEGVEFNFEEVVLLDSGKKATFLSTKKPLFNKQGQVIGLLGTSLDITKQKETENTLQEIISFSPGNIYWMDKNCVIEGCNEHQARFAGFSSSQEMIGKTDYDMPWKKHADEIIRLNNKIMATGETVTIEEEIKLPNGQKVIFLSTKVPRYNKQGELIGLLGVSIDITPQKAIRCTHLFE